jgi:hypothetical protein
LRLKFNIFFRNNNIKNKLDYFIYYYIFLNMLEKLKPKKIIFTCYYGINYSLVVAAKDLEIKTIELQHGIITPNHPGYIYPKKYKNKFTLPDYLITYGNYEKELLIKHSIWDEKQVIPLGCPRYDFLANYKIDKDKLKEKLGIPKDNKILFWATQTHCPSMIENGENKLNAKETFKAIKKNKDWFLLIKFHPAENQNKSLKFYNYYKKKYKLNRCMILKYDVFNTYDFITLSDCVILKHSVVGKETILMNKPIINFSFKNDKHLMEYKILKSSLLIKKDNDLNKFLRLIKTEQYKKIFSKEREIYLKRHFSNFGNATQKIIDFIKRT